MFGKGKREKAENLLATGSKGVGIVQNVQDTGMTVNDNPRVKMTFRIEPLDGSPAFEASKTKTVSRVEIPRAGDRYPVWYDQADQSTWMYATVDSDEGRASIRQAFGAAAESMSGVGDPHAAGAAPAAAPAADPIEQIKQLSGLRDAGAITDAEFEQKKAELLSQI
jgi:hypothetical protein